MHLATCQSPSADLLQAGRGRGSLPRGRRLLLYMRRFMTSVPLTDLSLGGFEQSTRSARVAAARVAEA